MKKRYLFSTLALLVLICAMCVPTVDAREATIGGLDSNGNPRYSVDSGGDMISAAGTYRYATCPIAYVTATEFDIGGIATDITASGLAGTAEAGSTEGFVTMAEAADYLLFYLPLPELYYYGNTAADLQLQFDLSQGAAATTGTYELKVYEYGLNNALMIDEDLSMNTSARAWVNSTAFGADASISGANEVFIIRIEPESAADDFNIYGCRLKYRVGMDVTQT